MVIDTSALIAILLQEEDAGRFAVAIKNDPLRLISAAFVLETAMVVESRLGPVAGRELDLLLHRSRADIVPFEAAQAEVARAA